MRADVVVVGGGSTGSSIAYHLAKSGVRDIVLVERGPGIASGQTSRSTALIRTHYTVPIVARMALLSYRFFKDFEKELPGTRRDTSRRASSSAPTRSRRTH